MDTTISVNGVALQPVTESTRSLMKIVIFIMTSLLLVPQYGHADDWLYTVRPGDNLWNISDKYLTRKEYASELLKLNQIKNPAQLQPGSVIRIPITWLKRQPSSSRLVHAQGEVTIIRAPGEQPESGNDEIRLYVGDTITTGANGTATLEFADKSRLLIQPDSELVMDTLSTFGDSGMVDTRLRLPAGRVETQVTPKKGPASRYEITTPAAVAAVRGTDFRVGADSKQVLSRSEVLEGKVAIKGERDTRDIPAGFGTVTKAGEPPTPPKKLLPAPGTGNTQSHFGNIPVSFEWRAVKQARAYRVQIYYAINFDTLLVDKVTDNNQFELDDLQDNDYLLRIRAIDNLGLEGLNQDHLFRVDARPFPPVLKSPVENAVIRNRQPAFKWANENDSPAYKLQIALDNDFNKIILESEKNRGTEFSPVIKLPETHLYWRVASLDSSGLRGPFSRTGRFQIRTLPDTPHIQSLSFDLRTMQVIWSSQADEMQYHFQMATDTNFENVIIDKKLGGKNSLNFPRPTSNIYYYRTRAINSAGETSPFSKVEMIHVTPINYNNPLIP
jgi:hypothetical protein